MGDIKKSKNKTGATIKNYMTDIRNAETIAAKEKTKLRCKCPHTDENGKALLFRSDNKKSEFTGNPLFVCRLCGAYLDTQRGTLKVTDVTPEEYPGGLSFLEDGNYHLYDYQFFYRNLEENVQDRIEQYLANQ